MEKVKQLVDDCLLKTTGSAKDITTYTSLAVDNVWSNKKEPIEPSKHKVIKRLPIKIML